MTVSPQKCLADRDPGSRAILRVSLSADPPHFHISRFVLSVTVAIAIKVRSTKLCSYVYRP